MNKQLKQLYDGMMQRKESEPSCPFPSTLSENKGKYHSTHKDTEKQNDQKGGVH